MKEVNICKLATLIILLAATSINNKICAQVTQYQIGVSNSALDNSLKDSEDDDLIESSFGFGKEFFVGGLFRSTKGSTIRFKAGYAWYSHEERKERTILGYPQYALDKVHHKTNTQGVFAEILSERESSKKVLNAFINGGARLSVIVASSGTNEDYNETFLSLNYGLVMNTGFTIKVEDLAIRGSFGLLAQSNRIFSFDDDGFRRAYAFNTSLSAIYFL